MPRAWKALLADAKARGLSQADVRREQGCTSSQVSHMCSYHGVTLTRDSAKKLAVWKTRLEAASELTLNEFCRVYDCGAAFARRLSNDFGHALKASDASRTDEKWARRFAQSAGLTLNQFCAKFRCSGNAARKAAVAHGHRFAPRVGAKYTRAA